MCFSFQCDIIGYRVRILLVLSHVASDQYYIIKYSRRVGCHLTAGTGRDPKNLRQVLSSFPEEGLYPVHEFSWWSLGRKAVDQQIM